MSKDILGAMPGDRIRYETGEGLQWGIVKAAGWQPTPNGGKVWTYETVDDCMVPAGTVVEVTQSARSGVSDEFESLPAMRKEGLLLMLEDCDFPSIIKVAISCLVKYDQPRSLEVAQFLIGTHFTS
jgi:hypothetical protein